MIYQFILKTGESGSPVEENSVLPTKLIKFFSDRIGNLKAQKECIVIFNGNDQILECLLKADYGTSYKVEFVGTRLEVNAAKNVECILSSSIPIFSSDSIDLQDKQILIYSNIVASLLPNCNGDAQCLGANANGQISSQDEL